MNMNVFSKIILLILVAFSGYSQELGIQRIDISESRKEIYKGKLTEEQLNKFRAFIEVTSESILSDNNNFVINYKQPESSCFYNHYRKKECETVDWFKKNIYNTINFSSETLNLFYQAKKLKEDKCVVKFDLSNFIYNNFMKENQLCYGLLVVNSSGEYRLLIGEYSSNDVNKFLEELNIIKA